MNEHRFTANGNEEKVEGLGEHVDLGLVWDGVMTWMLELRAAEEAQDHSQVCKFVSESTMGLVLG